jgi:hypothetical protein
VNFIDLRRRGINGHDAVRERVNQGILRGRHQEDRT